MSRVDIRSHNQAAWDKQVQLGNEWTIPVNAAAVAAARNGKWEIFLTPQKPVPQSWWPPLRGCNVLCLASGGGQQGPILAAAGANVTVFDNSPMQLNQDRVVAEREQLSLRTVAGDMRDLSIFGDESFDLIVHPVSNNFVPDIRPVWNEAYRVLRRGGALLAGFGNPAFYIFDQDLLDAGKFEVKNVLPHSDAESLSEDEIKRYAAEGRALEFSHTLEDQIGGQIAAGFVIAGFYEDYYEGVGISRYMPTFIATRAIKR